ncbi:GIY-YIG nuclease family protein [Flavobacterium sp. NRK F10]|uniref:GIY-YIG nuclease family protein n=1 Tax=Flavobacterium sp. NRK F10 TaxID=2954931 RepID=UPI0020913863|nr:GIY-YIG nuclease family protein [Flavobacterium sp. NRK F10]MCO6173588.1 GIY-YIG nuclease family protein [Flavobacterium sp. NRK F10]
MLQGEGFHTYFVYILTNVNKTVLYIGVTNNLKARIEQHKTGVIEKTKSFTARYNVKHLVYYEKFTWIQEAIAREKELKGWRREKKEALIRKVNPDMAFIEY